MKRKSRLFILAVLLVFSLTGITAAGGVTLQVENELDFDTPSLALLEYASFFVTDLGDFSDKPIMTISLENGYAEPITGYFSAELYASDGSKIGDGAIKELTVPPGPISWEAKAGGLTNVELLTDVLEYAVDNEEIPSEQYLKDAFDLGSVEEWEIDRVWGDKTWFKNNVFDYTEYTDFDADDIPELIDTALSLQVPAGTFRVEIAFNYDDPSGTPQTPATQSIVWEVTNPGPVVLNSPVDDAEGLTGDVTFAWQLPDLPAGFETTSTLIITDTLTGRSTTTEIDHTSGYDSEFTHTVSRSQFLAGRWYEWTVELKGSRGQVVGKDVPAAERFALSNTFPVINSLTAVGGTDDLWVGDNLTFTADYEDEGTPAADLQVEWLLDGSPVNPDGPGQYTYRSMNEGSHTIEVTVTDSFGDEDSASLTFAVNENLPPEVSIVNPDGKTDYIVGETLRLEGEVTDPEDEGFARIEWFVDGTRLASGESFELRLGNSGSREITLTAEDIRGNVSEDTLTIDVAENTPPVVTINSPDPGEYLFGDTLTLDAEAEDDLLAAADLEITWEVLGGETLSGASYTVPEREGEITLRAWTRDEQGQLGEDRVTISAKPNTPPEVVITSPEPGAAFTMEDNNEPVAVTVTAEASDPDEGQDLSWSWRLVNSNGQTVEAVESGSGSSASYTFNIDRQGIYTVTAEAVDSYGDSGESSVAFNVELPVPAAEPKVTLEVEITAPEAGATFYVGEEVSLQGRVTQQRFDNRNTAYTWMIGNNTGDPANPQNLVTIGTGQQLDYIFKSPGEKVFRLVAMNKNANNGIAAAAVTVEPNTPPEISIEGVPADGMIQGSEVILTADASDEEHGVTVSWQVNGMEPPAGAVDGSTLNLSFLGIGNNTIIATARDDIGARTSAEVVIPVRANQAPAVRITSCPEEVVVGSLVRVSYQAADPDDDPVTVSPAVLNPAGNEVAVSESGSGFSFTAAGTGDYIVTVSAADSRGAESSATEIVSSVPNQPPVVRITAPEPGSTVTTGEAFDIYLNAADPEGDGIAGVAINGTAVDGFSPDSSGNMVLPYTVNTTGAVELNIVVTDDQGKAGSTSIGLIAREPEVQVVQNQAPVVELQVPAATEGGFNFGSTLTMTAAVNDPDNAPEEIVVNWLVNGELAGTGLSLEYRFVTAGNNTVEVRAADVSGAAGTAEAVIPVRANQPAAGSITAPAAGTEFTAGDTVELEARGSDPEGEAVSFVWLLDEEIIGSGPASSHTVTEAGRHRLTLRVTDPYGAGNEYTMNLEVAPPAGETVPPEIVMPLDRMVMASSETIALQAENIPEEAEYVWRSSLEGVLADNQELSLSPGEHLIMLLVNNIQVDSATLFVVAVETESVAAPTGILSGEVTLRLGERELALDAVSSLEYEFYPGNVLVVGEGSSIEVYFYDTETSEELGTGTYRFTETGYNTEAGTL